MLQHFSDELISHIAEFLSGPEFHRYFAADGAAPHFFLVAREHADPCGNLLSNRCNGLDF
jgi:hypothetical protein